MKLNLLIFFQVGCGQKNEFEVLVHNWVKVWFVSQVPKTIMVMIGDETHETYMRSPPPRSRIWIHKLSFFWVGGYLLSFYNVQLS